MNELVQAFDWRSRAVLFRNALVYLRNWKTAFFPPAMEPVVFFVALGLGLSGVVGELQYGERTITYAAFVAPGLLAYTGFTTPFYEALYGSYVRMFYQKTWDGILVTQVELPHVVWGEILWAGLRGAMNAAVVAITLGVLHAIGMVELEWTWLPVLPLLAMVAGWAFGAAGLIFTGLVPSIDHMNYPTFLVGWPLSLVSNTIFPVPTHIPAIRFVMELNPIYHLAELCRSLLLLGRPAHVLPLFVSTAVLLVVAAFVDLRVLRRRVIG
ncbi:MAG: ABC transporter permease [Polyangiales bacterium]|nr:ABC transporter permease [Myxococcales bacterium]